MSETNNEPIIRLHQKKDENREKNRKSMFGSALSEANNEPTLTLHQKSWQKIEKLFLAQNCLNRIMSQLLDYTKRQQNRE